jgi:formylglycine-generating enzyme required for sulfatase activity
MSVAPKVWAFLLLMIFAAACRTAPAPVAQELEPSTFRDCGDCPEMTVVPAGSFEMGSESDPNGWHKDELPQHRVTIGKAFAVARHEVTVAEYRRFAEATGDTSADWKIESNGGRDGELPVTWVSWSDAQRYVRWLSTKAGKPYRLLSEAEWEYAAAGGAAPKSSNAADEETDIGQYQSAMPVGSFRANGYGLSDMPGNVAEWVEDCYADDYRNAPADGSALEGDCKKRVVRDDQNPLAPGRARLRDRTWGFIDARSNGNRVGIRVARDLP